MGAQDPLELHTMYIERLVFPYVCMAFATVININSAAVLLPSQIYACRLDPTLHDVNGNCNPAIECRLAWRGCADVFISIPQGRSAL